MRKASPIFFCCHVKWEMSARKLCLHFSGKNSWVIRLVANRRAFPCACVNPLNDNSVDASNLMAGNRKLARKVTVLLKAISLVL